MRFKFALFGLFLLAAVLSMVTTFSVIPGQHVLASLLEGTVPNDQNNLGELLIQNETADEGTPEGEGEGEGEGQQQQGQEQTVGDNPDATSSIGDTTGEKLPKQQSEIVIQDMEDTALVDRIFPDILAKLDGATILKKVDGKQLLEKLDGTQLLEKILPYAKITVKPITVPLPTRVFVGSCPPVPGAMCGGSSVSSVAKCGPEDGVAVGGIFDYDIQEGDIKLRTELSGSDAFTVGGQFDTDGSVRATVLCMKLDAVTSPTPGGDPLTPPG